LIITTPITDLRALTNPQLTGLISRALESGALLAPVTLDEAAEDIFEFVLDPDKFMIVGMEHGGPTGLMLGYFSTSALFPYPTIVLLYNEGSRAMARALSKAGLDMINTRGYTKALALNGTGRSDNAWIRFMAPEGTSGKVLGSMISLEVD
jgi:hypothetical protein